MNREEKKAFQQEHGALADKIKYAVEDVLDAEREQHPEGNLQYVLAFQLITPAPGGEKEEDRLKSISFLSHAEPLVMGRIGLMIAQSGQAIAIESLGSPA